VLLQCPCEERAVPPCSSAKVFAVAGSDLDSGYNGLGHNAEIVEGASIALRIARRCSNDSNLCESDADCGAGCCNLTCDCDGPDTECEITGPTHERRCLRSLEPCDTEADCPPQQACEHFFGPPLPLSAAGTPVCVTTVFRSDVTGTTTPPPALTGTADLSTGETEVSASLRSRVHLGELGTQPCPRCGQLSQDPDVGDVFTCERGPNNGQPCTVNAVSPDFGGVSFDCPPDAADNVSGFGLAIIFDNVTTGTVAKQTGVACAPPLDAQHPSSGNPLLCLDDFSACTTNADCSRCSNNLQTPCDTNADCSDGGTCAVAPDQPVTCGIFCHCGYCDNDPDQPCFSDADCSDGGTCAAGELPVLTQGQPNACDTLLCGEKAQDECCPSSDATCINGGTPLIGECSLASFRLCNSNADCSGTNSGTCVFGPRPCFDLRIRRTGTPDPLDRLCCNTAGDGPPICTATECDTNADCSGGNECIDAASPVSAGLFCIPPTANDGINSAGGIPGPGAISLRSLIEVCRCGDGKIGCDEQCDDGDLANGDGCNESCQEE
jgi:hypothetical protein